MGRVDSRLDRRQALYAGVGVAAAGLAGGAGWLWTRSGSSGAGTQLWRARGHPYWGLIAGGGVVYVLGTGLSAISGRTGKPLWQARQVGYDGVAGPGVVLTTFRPALAASINGVSCTAQDARSGKVRWTYNAAGQHEIGGIAYGGGTFYLADQQAGLLALDPLTGHRRWATPIRGTATALAFADGVVYLSALTSAAASTGLVSAMAGADGRPLWDSPSIPMSADVALLIAGTDTVCSCNGDVTSALDPGTGQLRWQASAGPRYPSAVADGILLLMPGASGSTHVLAALTASSGRPAWQRELAGKPLEAATCNETFLVAAADGTLYAIAARTGSVLWKRRLASSPAGLAADPALSVAYAADSTDAVYAFGV
jgi:outer membrane protein assembly factor BamB